MKTRPVRMSLDGAVDLPSDITWHPVASGQTLFIAPRSPGWVVLDPPEAEALQRMLSGATLREVRLVLASHGLSDDAAHQRLADLLTYLHVAEIVPGPRDDDQTEYVRLQAHVTNRCNLRCSHCYVSSGEPFPDELELADWVDVLDVVAARHERVQVSFSGGEPLTVPWIAELVRHAKERLGCNTALITNGLLWSDERIRKLATHLDYVAVSLDGASPATHDALRGPGTFDRALDGIRRLQRAGIRVVLNVTLRAANAGDLIENLPSLVEGLDGPVDVDVANFVLEGRGTAQHDQPLPPGDFQQALNALAVPFLSAGHRPIRQSRRLNCGYGSSFVVYANGDVSPCLSPRFIRGNVKRDGAALLLDAIAREAGEASVDALPLCRTCDLRYLCGGRCHLPQFASTLRMEQNDCPREYREAFYAALAQRAQGAKRTMLPLVGAARSDDAQPLLTARPERG